MSPLAAKRPCARAGCPELVARPARFCQAHADREHAYDQERGTATARGYDARWRRARLAWLGEHPLCADPYQEHQSRPVAAAMVDHIRPHRGDVLLFWDHGNWQSLCDSCNTRKTGEGA